MSKPTQEEMGEALAKGCCAAPAMLILFAVGLAVAIVCWVALH